MKLFNYILLVLFLFQTEVSTAQYYTPAGLTAVESARSANEGDMYLDTTNNDLRIGLTHRKLGSLNDNQDFDSIILSGDSIKVYLQNSIYKAVDISSFLGTSVTEGDIKTGIQAIDHNGWYLLDGRVLASLPAVAQTAAATLGIVGNLPNADNQIEKTQTGAEIILATGGSATQTLVQTNLPAYNVTGTTSSGGSHAHTGTIDAVGDHTHGAEQQGFGLGKQGFTNSNSNKDDIIVQGGSVGLVFDDDGEHTHTTTLNTTGNHTHTVTIASGGSSTSFDLYQPYMVANRFIYLGQ
jgi:hypothetical protein